MKWPQSVSYTDQNSTGSPGDPTQDQSGLLWDYLRSLRPGAAQSPASGYPADQGALWDQLTNNGQWLSPQAPSAPGASQQGTPQSRGLLGDTFGRVEHSLGGLLGNRPAANAATSANGAQTADQSAGQTYQDWNPAQARARQQAQGQQPQGDWADQLVAQNRPHGFLGGIQTLLHAWGTGRDWNQARTDLTLERIQSQMLPNQIRAGVAQAAINNAINARIAQRLGLSGGGGYPAPGYATDQQPQGAPGIPSAGVPGYPAAGAAVGAPADSSGASWPAPAAAGGALPPVPQTPNLPPVPSLAPTSLARAPTLPAAMAPQPGQPGQLVARRPMPAVPQAQAGGAGSFPIDRDTLALMAYQGNPGAAEAWKIEQPNYTTDRESGGVLDATTGQPNGARFARRTNVNGFEFDPYDPNAPSYLPKAPADGAEPLYDQRGVPVGWRMMDGSMQTIEQAEQSQSRGKARGDLHTLKDAQGRDVPVWGTEIPGGSAGGPYGGYGGPGGGAAAGGPSVGFGQSTSDAEFDKAAAGALSQRIDQDTGAREGSIAAGQQAAQALAFVKTHPMNPGAPYAADWANNLRALSQNVPSLFSAAKIADIDRAASDPATYERLATQAQLQGAKTLLPSRYTERELHMLGRIYPQLETPNDSAAMFWAQYGSMADRQKAQADFAASYSGPKNVGAYTKAWSDSPAGQRSIFQDPIWNGVTVNGRPAVAYVTRKNPKTGATEQFGAFMPYDKNGAPNPNAYVFRVR